MSERLSISATTSSEAERIALVINDKNYSYREIAARCSSLRAAPETPELLAPSLDLPSLLRIYGAFDGGRPLCLLPPNANVQELASRFAQRPKATALVVFTSGSSGVPKGVCLSREALAASAQRTVEALEARRRHPGTDIRWLCCLPIHHVGGLAVVLRCLFHRQTLIVSATHDTASLHAALCAQRATHVSLVPTQLQRLVAGGHRAPHHLEVCLLGGARLDSDLRRRAEDLGYPISEGYGMSESGSFIALDGVPLPGVEIQERRGCLAFRSPTALTGYLPPHRAASDADGFVHTRDRFRWEGKRIEILGRDDDVIISGGENIELGDVERALCKHPAVSEAHALGLADAEWGQRLVALVVLRGDAVATCADDILQSTAHGLSGAHKPKSLVVCDALPRLSNGKIDRLGAMAMATSVDDKPSR